jgi:hypothetical protein
MTEKTWLYLIIAGVVLLTLVLFRGSLKRLLFKANAEGLEAELETHERHPNREAQSRPSESSGVSIKRNWQIGKGNSIDVGYAKADVEKNKQLGSEQSIKAKPENTSME